ncbi:MAG: Response regulator containing a CheY-like receiver domain and an HD-GYP domain [uncultured Sulfurovum sp.]|uniref:Response regulator containing a CheY-like receiver domain and an HD-GYP domain n=1 Tax=uncultured Sulfurovum sp. TaxID=269237 RepID=A0A6S6TMD8_9BACT|nr:MAG: Response regulator containing a CheY-like receiver domain and an HD-GYP domain [uncultured Sulfurovum sp.]
MKDKIAFYYQKLSLIQKLSIPLLMASIFGFILTVVIVKQVQLIDDNTIFLKNELIPTLEKSNNNLALLKNISENLTFATLAAEEEMVLEITENQIVRKNLRSIIENENLNIINVEVYLNAFEEYFEIAKQYALIMIKSSSLSEKDVVHAETLILKFNEVEKYFSQLKSDIEVEVSLRAASNHQLSSEVIYFTITFIIVFAVVLFFTSYINYKDFNDYDIIEGQRKELERVNNNLQSSIECAFLIQEAILPSSEILDKYTKDNFACWKQKGSVGGDIYFVAELESENEVLVMVIDGVGHGVSGAFLTILVKAIETQIVKSINKGTLEKSPAKILEYFNRSIKVMLKQEKGSKSNTGFDGGILYYNKETNVCKYAGAKTALYIINDNELEIIKSDRVSVGFVRTKMDQVYTEHNIAIEEGTKLYILTDGVIDQEGKNNSMYGQERFGECILSNRNKSFQEQQDLLEQSVIEFSSGYEQSDDVTVLGMQFI